MILSARTKCLWDCASCHMGEWLPALTMLPGKTSEEQRIPSYLLIAKLPIRGTIISFYFNFSMPFFILLFRHVFMLYRIDTLICCYTIHVIATLVIYLLAYLIVLPAHLDGSLFNLHESCSS